MTGLTLRHDQLRRRLPRTVRPMTGETIDSYLLRLAAANHLTAADLAAHLATRPFNLATTVALPVLAGASGHNPAVLARALPELGPNPPAAGQRTPAAEDPVPRSACRRCTATKGAPGAVVVWTVPERNICLRHRLWTGQGVIAPHDQIDLAEHPQVVHAQLRHHRLVDRFGPVPTRAAHWRASQLWVDVTWRGWGEPYHIPRDLHPEQPPHPNRRAGSGAPWRLHTDDPAYHAATYPETVTLAGLIAHPHWHALAMSDTDNDHDRFHAELWRRLPTDTAAQQPRLPNLRNLLRHATGTDGHPSTPAPQGNPR